MLPKVLPSVEDEDGKLYEDEDGTLYEDEDGELEEKAYEDGYCEDCDYKEEEDGYCEDGDYKEEKAYEDGYDEEETGLPRSAEDPAAESTAGHDDGAGSVDESCCSESSSRFGLAPWRLKRRRLRLRSLSDSIVDHTELEVEHTAKEVERTEG